MPVPLTYVIAALPFTCNLLVPSSVAPINQRPAVILPASFAASVPPVWNTIAFCVFCVPIVKLPPLV